MDENTYVNEAFSPVKKLTTTLIYYFIKMADGKLLMNVKDIKVWINKQKDARGSSKERTAGFGNKAVQTLR